MAGVLIGFAIIAAIIGTGYVVGRVDLLGPHAQPVIAKLVFFVLSPSLLFTILADAKVSDLFSPILAVSLLSAFSAFAVFAFFALVVWRRKLPEAVIGSLASGYVNANNIGIPVSLYVLGDASYSAPVILLQLLIVAPVALGILDISTGGGASFGRVITQPLRNPIIIGSTLGVIVSVTGITIPDAVMEPFRIIGAAAVPLMLISYGMSLHGARILKPGTGRKDVVLASALKLLLMPTMAWLLGHFVFHLQGHELFVAVALASLPTAQNVFNFAQRYGRGSIVARDTILITTVASMPVLVAASVLLR